MDYWIRTCQACNHKQKDRDPKDQNLGVYCDRKCKRCQSSALDYGTMKVEDDPKDTTWL